jgi:5-methylcytosine-specific restriction endonuclease McrA
MKRCANNCCTIKPYEEFHKNKATKDGLTSMCKTCNRQKVKAYRSTKAGKISHSRYNKKYKQNPEIYAKWHEYVSNYYGTAVGKVRVLNAVNKRRAKKLKATPLWLTKDQHEEIASFYFKSCYLSSLTGIKHEVDHVIPLQGKTVCGLHVPWNLQVITKKQNQSKGASLDLKFTFQKTA